MRIRDATDSDVPAILAIYNDVVSNTTAIYDERVSTFEERQAWFDVRRQKGLPVLVGELNGEVVGFSGMGLRNDVVAKGWLRLSHRELDEEESTETQPVHPHRRIQKLAPGQVALADVEILPSSTIFEAGSSLRLVVQGHELRDYPALGHSDLVNRGRHRLFAGGRHDAFLAVPVIEVTR